VDIVTQEWTLPARNFTEMLKTNFTVCFKESNTRILVLLVVILRLIYCTRRTIWCSSKTNDVHGHSFLLSALLIIAEHKESFVVRHETCAES